MFGNHEAFADNAAIATIPVRDSDRAKAFYEETLGLKRVEERPGAITYRTGDVTLLVYQSDQAGTNKATAATWVAKDVEGVVRDLKKRGVAFERYDDLPGLAMVGDIHVGGDMKVAWFKDPDGNILSIVSS